MTRDEKLLLLDNTLSTVRRKILPPGSVDEESRQVLIQMAEDQLRQLFDELEALEASGQLDPEGWEGEWLRRSELILLPLQIFTRAAEGEYRPYDEIEYWHSVAVKTIAHHLGYPEQVIADVYERSMEMIPGGSWEGYRLERSKRFDLLDQGRFYVGQKLNEFLLTTVVDSVKREVERVKNPRAVFGAVIYAWMMDLAMALDSQLPPSEAEKILDTTLERLNSTAENVWEPAIRRIQTLSGPEYEQAMSELMLSIQHELNGLERGAWEDARRIRWGAMRPWWSDSPMWQSFISLFWGSWLMKTGVGAARTLARASKGAIQAARKWTETTSAIARMIHEATGEPVSVFTTGVGTQVAYRTRQNCINGWNLAWEGSRLWTGWPLNPSWWSYCCRRGRTLQIFMG